MPGGAPRPAGGAGGQPDPMRTSVDLMAERGARRNYGGNRPRGASAGFGAGYGGVPEGFNGPGAPKPAGAGGPRRSGGGGGGGGNRSGGNRGRSGGGGGGGFGGGGGGGGPAGY
jgi:hypothetical protein